MITCTNARNIQVGDVLPEFLQNDNWERVVEIKVYRDEPEMFVFVTRSDRFGLTETRVYGDDGVDVVVPG